jgi:hypothetical protein
MIQFRKAQSTIEYLLLFAGVIAILIYFVVKSGSPYQSKLNESYDTATNTLVTTSNSFFNSF